MGTNEELWYCTPAGGWDEALPVGNGRIGAMIYGDPEHEIMQLNEDSIWYGGPMDRINPDARPNLEKVRRLILDQRIPEAEELLKYAFSGTPQSMRPYQPLGRLHLDMRTPGVLSADRYRPDRYRVQEKACEDKGAETAVTSYRRWLSLAEGVHSLTYTQCGITYRRETLASYPDQVIAVHLTADREGALFFSCLLERDRFLDWSGKAGESCVMLKGSGGLDGVRFCGAVSVQAEGGRVSVIGEHIVVDGADAATVLIGAGTSYYCGEDYEKTALLQLENAAKAGFENIRRNHLKDYRELYNRVFLSLGEDMHAGESTGERLKLLKERGRDNGLLVTYFNFGRYLLISSSRPGTLPANLQGIWNDKMNPKWDSKFTININTEMNYWPAECCNLPECHMPLFDLLKRMQKSGHEVAMRMYGCRGFAAHHNTDLWGDCAPQDFWIPATYWVMGGAWLCLHIWNHYLYCQDKEWLSSMYGILREAVLFYEDFLVEEAGMLLTCPSCSPENTYIMADGTQGRVTAGPAMDNELLRELIGDYLKASEILGIRDEVVEAAEKIPEKLPPLRIGKHGQIMEWREDYDEIEPGHRHISQLYALYPGHEITVDGTPELAEAAKRTLNRRLLWGGGHTGWSCAWVIGFFSALHMGNEAHEHLVKMLNNSTNCNLMDTHPLNPTGTIFQIDGNLGAAADIIHMLVQADENRIRLLPALPDTWPEGKLEGVCVPGKAALFLEWKEGRLIKAGIRAKQGGHFSICWQDREWIMELSSGEERMLDLKAGAKKEEK